jgi:hypothetical protein
LDQANITQVPPAGIITDGLVGSTLLINNKGILEPAEGDIYEPGWKEEACDVHRSKPPATAIGCGILLRLASGFYS